VTPARAFALGFAGLLAAAGALGAGLGWRTAGLSETEIIEHYAALYAARGAGAERGHCHAEPGRAMLERLVVVCTPPGRPEARVAYHVAPWGQLWRADTPADRTATPEEPRT
jgi:hypothetical protein